MYIVEIFDFVLFGYLILEGVIVFKGEGVFFIIVVDYNVFEVNIMIFVLVFLDKFVKCNDGFGIGVFILVIVDDVVLVVVIVGVGRIVGYFDCNIFFNVNGVGMDIIEYDNC